MTIDGKILPQWPPCPERPTLLSLPVEIRHIILESLFTPLTISPSICSTPRPDTTSDDCTPATTTITTQATHPSLAILTTCRLLHAEALPVVARNATLCLRTRTQSALLGKPVTQPSNISLSSAPTSTAAPPTAPSDPRTISPHPRRPLLSSIRSLHIAWPLLSSYPSPVLLSIFTSLKSLRISGIAVSVSHGVLLNLWRERWAQTGMLRSSVDKQEAYVMGRGVQGEKRMLLLQALLCWLEEGECDVLLDVLGAARERWCVKMGWKVGCASCKGGQEEAWEEGRQCVLGVLGVEVGVEV